MFDRRARTELECADGKFETERAQLDVHDKARCRAQG